MDRLEETLHKQAEIRKEHLWYSLTMFTVNGSIIILDNTIISPYLLIIGSSILSIYALKIILERAVAYHNINIDYENDIIEINNKSNTNDSNNSVCQKKDRLTFTIMNSFILIIKEQSGSLFYFILILFSYFGVILSKSKITITLILEL